MATFQSLQFFLLSFLTSIILMIFIRFKLFPSSLKIKKCLPPSPRKLPILGNLHQLGSHPHQSLHALSKKYGPLMLIHIGSIPTLVASSVDAAQGILKTHDSSFSSRPNMSIVKILFYGGKNLIFSPQGEHWRKMRSVLVTRLVSNARVKSFRKVREEETMNLIGALEDSHGSLVDLSALIVKLTNTIICKVAFGRVHSGPKFTNLLKEHVEMIATFSVGSYIPWLSWVDRLTGLEGRAKKGAEEFDVFIEGVIEEHVNKKGGMEAKGDDVQDVVDILLEFQNENTTDFTLDRDSLKAVILDVFAGGTDTTFNTLVWVLSELIRNPRVMKKLQQEVTKVAQGRSMLFEEDFEKMEYLKAVIKESYRLHPPAPFLLPRESVEDVKMMGYDIPAGTRVFVNVWAIGRDPTVWENFEEFKPERFMDSSVDFRGHHFELIPFGAGRRGCPAIHFSVTILELVLTNLIYKFDFRLPDGEKIEDMDMSERNGLTVHKKAPLLVVPTPR
ncbi:cytochrome P450 Tp4149 [Lactuca sativa]|nr:cytochrome P450 Tp4149 [Lactuca sativa]